LRSHRRTHDHRARRVRADSESDALLADASFRSGMLAKSSRTPRSRMAAATQPDCHIIGQQETDHGGDLTGLGACGAHMALAVVSEHARQGHPLLPVIQVAQAEHRGVISADDNSTCFSPAGERDQSRWKGY